MPIGVTLGDACGVGPEILLRTCAFGNLTHPIVVFGDVSVLTFAREKLGLSVDVHVVDSPADASCDALHVIDLGLLQAEDVTIGKVSREVGAAAVKYIEAATRQALTGAIDAIVTLPVNKEACRLSSPDFQGHTELIAGMCGINDYTMMLAAPELLVTHVSTHVSMREAIEQVKTGRILSVLQLTHGALHKLKRKTRIAVSGLNPHAGEGGAFGREEIEEIAPAIEAARARGIDAHGPLPPDTLFMKALAGDYGAVVCMYHDQGHIAMKLHGFATTVNVTVGLPIVRTSVDHGTAFDIAYQGIASTENFAAALDLAAQLARKTVA